MKNSFASWSRWAENRLLWSRLLFDNQAAVEVAITSNWSSFSASWMSNSFLRSLHEPKERKGSLLFSLVMHQGSVTWIKLMLNLPSGWFFRAATVRERGRNHGDDKGRINAAKLLRACGGCLGASRR